MYHWRDPNDHSLSDIIWDKVPAAVRLRRTVSVTWVYKKNKGLTTRIKPFAKHLLKAPSILIEMRDQFVVLVGLGKIKVMAQGCTTHEPFHALQAPLEGSS
jgi:hypothetical protein